MIQIKDIRASVFRHKNNPVVKGSLIYTTASLFNASIPFFLLPVLTNYLTPEEYGIVSTFMVTSSIFLLFIGLEQHGFISTNYFSLKLSDLKNHVFNIWFFSSLLFAALFTIVLMAQTKMAGLLELPSKWILLAIIVSYFQFVSQLNLTIWQLEMNSLAFGIFQVLNSLVNYCLSIVLIVFLNFSEDGRISGIATAAFLFGVLSFYILRQKGFLSYRPNLKAIKSCLVFSLPLVPHALASWVNTSLDKILINNIVSVSENGVYSISYQIAMLVGMFASAFNRAFAPFLFKNLTESDSDETKLKLVRYTYAYYLILAFITVILFVASPLLVDILVGQEFQGAQAYLLWLMIGFLADGLYYGVVNYLFYARKTHFISFVTITSCVLHFLVSFFLIPVVGTIGAAYATAASFIFSFVCIFYLSNRIYPMPWSNFLKIKR